jgi:hypothetical protein
VGKAVAGARRTAKRGGRIFFSEEKKQQTFVLALIVGAAEN